MSPRSRESGTGGGYRLDPERLRWRCDLAAFAFETTEDITECPINIIGQPRATEALELGLSVRGEGYNVFISGRVGCGRATVVRRTLAALDRGDTTPDDVAFVHNFRDPDEPRRLSFPAGQGCAFRHAMESLVASLGTDLPQIFDSEPYAQRVTGMRERAAEAQRARLKEFEKHIQEEGFALIHVQVGPVMAPQLQPVVDGNPTEMEKLESLVEAGQFKAEDYEALKGKLSRLRAQMEGVAKELRNFEHDLQRGLAESDRELAEPLVQEAVAEVRTAYWAEGVADYLDELAENLLDNLDAIRRGREYGGSEDGTPGEPYLAGSMFCVNVVVDNSQTQGRPIIWETAPSYRNLFGTIDAIRVGSGEWSTDHARIKAGSLMRASGGILVVDALDLLVEPGVWASLKRSLRTGKVEIHPFDTQRLMAGISLKPEASPIDVKVVMIGTPQIYGMLYAVDEDFKKVFKIKAAFALHTPLDAAELQNYVCFVHKKVQDDGLRPFTRAAVGAIVEEGVRLAGDRTKLTTRFADIADLIREASYWAGEAGADVVGSEHVDQALARSIYRVNLLEEMMLERLADGTVLMDLEGTAVGQVNGLAVLDVGDHQFGQPSRITASTAMGRSGIIDIDREAKMSGAIHTKGVLILSGFLRSRFAQNKPLTLTASLAFEQNYGAIDGDSASSTELYALISALSGVPIRQGIAVTGSVNQRGEIQPIGGVNEKIQGYYDLCRLRGLTGDQGVMIPARNEGQLMLRKDVVEAVRAGRFHVHAVCTIEEGLETLTGEDPGQPGDDGRYPPDTIFGKVDAELTRLAEAVRRYTTPQRRGQV